MLCAYFCIPRVLHQKSTEKRCIFILKLMELMKMMSKEKFISMCWFTYWEKMNAPFWEAYSFLCNICWENKHISCLTPRNFINGVYWENICCWLKWCITKIMLVLSIFCHLPKTGHLKVSQISSAPRNNAQECQGELCRSPSAHGCCAHHRPSPSLGHGLPINDCASVIVAVNLIYLVADRQQWKSME